MKRSVGSSPVIARPDCKPGFFSDAGMLGGITAGSPVPPLLKRFGAAAVQHRWSGARNRSVSGEELYDMIDIRRTGPALSGV